MAEFCEQCAKDLAFPYGDFREMTTEEDWANRVARQVLCEGCGPIQVDPQGNCVTPNCYKNHGDESKWPKIKTKTQEGKE